MVSTLQEKKDPASIKESLDEVVDRLEQDQKSSESWGTSITSNRERWETLKKKIRERQSELKRLVVEKKAGTIGTSEFEEKYRRIQDELTELEFEVYNLRLGTSVKI
jgi:chromosome segregation ATPase